MPNWVIMPTGYLDHYNTTNSWVVGSAMLSESTDGIRQATLWPYTGNDGIYRCPSDKSLWPYGNRRAPRPFNVALSAALNGGLDGENGRALDPVVVERLAELRRPVGVFTFIDEEEVSMTSGAFFFGPNQTNFWATIPGCRDKGCGANVAFADGHVSFKKWQWLGRTRTGLRTYVQNQLDRADLAWLMGAVP